MSLGIKLVQAVQKEAAMKRPFPLVAEAAEDMKSGRKTRVVSAQVRVSDHDRFSHLAEKVIVHAEGAGRDGLINFVRHGLSTSCPASCRASTSCRDGMPKNVDGRDKPGHDGRLITRWC